MTRCHFCSVCCSSMALNGGDEQQVYQTEYAEQTADYLELIGLGLDAQVAKELDQLFQEGEKFRIVSAIGSNKCWHSNCH